MIALRPLSVSDAPDLLAFETRNRRFFEAWVPPRPDGFFAPEDFARRVTALVNDPDIHPFLIWRDGQIVGRLNLTARGSVAEIGYRVAQAARGQGIAARAVALALDQTQGRFDRLEAETQASNTASERVLTKAGFHLTGETRSVTHPDGSRVRLRRWARTTRPNP